MNTPSIQHVLDSARERLGGPSLRGFARELGIDAATLLRLHRGHSLPSEATMLKLSYIARISDGKGLLLLNMWRSKGHAAATYRDLYKRLCDAPHATPRGKEQQRTNQPE